MGDYDGRGRIMSRRAKLTVAVSLAGLPFIIPHVVEDFGEGIAGRAGLSTGVAAALLGAWLAAEALGLVLLARGRRAGWALTFWIALVWTLVAVADHGPAVLGGGFRTGALSVVWAAGLVASRATVAALAWRGWRGPSGH